MSNRKLTILGIVAAAMLAGAMGLSYLGKPAAGPVVRGASLIQGLATGQIGAITMGSGDDGGFTLRRAGKGFVVAQKDDYPASMGKINELIMACLDIKITELVTENPANHAELEVTEEQARNVVKFLDDNGEMITGVVIGNKAIEGGGRYVRVAGSDAVYLAAEAPRPDSRVVDYLETLLFEVEKNDIERVTVSDPNGMYVIVTDPNGDAVLEGVPEGKKAKTRDCDYVLRALGHLEFKDVKRASDAAAELNFDRSYVCRLKDSTVYTLAIAVGEGGTYYVKCKADFTDTTQVVKEQGVESEEQLKAKEAKLLAREAAGKFTAQHEGWDYELAGWQAGNLVKGFDELIEDTESAAEGR